MFKNHAIKPTRIEERAKHNHENHVLGFLDLRSRKPFLILKNQFISSRVLKLSQEYP